VAVLFPIGLSKSTYCREQAADCARHAERAILPENQASFRELEQGWLHAARAADTADATDDPQGAA
jgi:hypothetical protein